MSIEQLQRARRQIRQRYSRGTITFSEMRWELQDAEQREHQGCLIWLEQYAQGREPGFQELIIAGRAAGFHRATIAQCALELLSHQRLTLERGQLQIPAQRGGRL